MDFQDARSGEQGNEGGNSHRPIQAPQTSMTRMDVFKQRLASTEKTKYKKTSTRIKPRQYNERVDKLLYQAIRIAGFYDGNIIMKYYAEMFNVVQRLLISAKVHLITHWVDYYTGSIDCRFENL